MNVRGDFLKFPYSTNTTALICKSRKACPGCVVRLTDRPDVTIDVCLPWT